MLQYAGIWHDPKWYRKYLSPIEFRAVRGESLCARGHATANLTPHQRKILQAVEDGAISARHADGPREYRSPVRYRILPGVLNRLNQGGLITVAASGGSELTLAVTAPARQSYDEPLIPPWRAWFLMGGRSLATPFAG